MRVQACKDKRGVLQESLDKVKLSYSQITAQTTEMTQQAFHMTSHVRSQVNAVLPHAKNLPDWHQMHGMVHFAAVAGHHACGECQQTVCQYAVHQLQVPSNGMPAQ